jgi:membrane protein
MTAAAGQRTGLPALFKQTFNDWLEDKAPRLAAALAYYTLFAIAPLLIIVIAVAGLVFGAEAARGQIMAQIGGIVGESGVEAIQDIVASASEDRSTGIAATVLGLFTLLVGATGVFGQLQDALNTIWEVKPKPRERWTDVIKERFAPFTMVVGIAFLLLVSMVVSAGVAALGEYVTTMLPGVEIAAHAATFLLSFAVITLLFAMIYKILPDAKIAWSDVWIGAAVTALLFSVGKFLIGLYIGKSSAESAYGAAGSLVVVLLWVYYSAQILFFGAEFTQVYARERGSGIRPKENAVLMTREAREQQGMPRKDEKREPARPAAAPRRREAKS